MTRSRRKPVDAVPVREDPDVLATRMGTQIPAELLGLALTHRSFAHEAGGVPTNERLEFLGDSVLGIIVTERLYRDHPDVAEGELAKMRAATVSQRALATVARELGIGEFIKLGRGELGTNGREKDSILSDTVEALIGATYLTHGLEHTRVVVESMVARLLDDAHRRGEGLDWKTTLQELTASLGRGVPRYDVTGEGPDHQRWFRAIAMVDEQPVGHGEGTTKKQAEQTAAQDAVGLLSASDVSETGVPASGGSTAIGA